MKNGKYKRHRLTPSSTFHFFGRNRKDVYYLDHNFDDHVHHSCSRCNASVYVKPLKETFDAVEDIDEFVLTRGGIFSRLGARGQNRLHKSITRYTDRKKNIDPRKDYTRRWKCLHTSIRAEVHRRDIS